MHIETFFDQVVVGSVVSYAMMFFEVFLHSIDLIGGAMKIKLWHLSGLVSFKSGCKEAYFYNGVELSQFIYMGRVTPGQVRIKEWNGNVLPLRLFCKASAFKPGFAKLFSLAGESQGFTSLTCSQEVNGI